MTQTRLEQTPSTGRPNRILLVEDDIRIVNFMQRGLEAEGMTLDVAWAKAPALQLAESHRYDAIILDIYLGDENGLELCRSLRQRAITSPILTMTANHSMELREASVQAGASAYFAKPFSFEDLLSTLEKAYRAHSKIDVAATSGGADAMTSLNHGLPSSCQTEESRMD